MLLPKLIAAVLPAITDMLCLLTAKIDMQIADKRSRSINGKESHFNDIIFLQLLLYKSRHCKNEKKSCERKYHSELCQRSD